MPRNIKHTEELSSPVVSIKHKVWLDGQISNPSIRKQILH